MDPHAACRVLGVPPGASEADVKSAYRNAAMKFHPDRNAGLGADAERVAAEHFRRAAEAYDVLSHPHARGSSGRYGSHARRSGNGGRSEAGRKSGYYNGAADPFGFQYKHSARVGDHMRRIDGNIRALYATLAVVGVMLYLAPQPKSPAETARRRRRVDRSTHAFTERAVTSLAPGSPLDSSDARERRRRASASHGDGASVEPGTGLTRFDATRRDDVATADEWDSSSFRYAYEGGGARAPGRSAALRPYGSAGERAFAEANASHGVHGDKDDRANDASECTPEWASGGFSGRGVSRRVLPYRRRRGGAGDAAESRGAGVGDASSSDGRGAPGVACARCRAALPLTARYCSICGARVTSPASVVATAAEDPRGSSPNEKTTTRKNPRPSASPLADPQDTGSSAGRGRARAAADREANAGGEPG